MRYSYLLNPSIQMISMVSEAAAGDREPDADPGLRPGVHHKTGGGSDSGVPQRCGYGEHNQDT